MKWRYESMVDSVCQAICGGSYGPDAIKQFLMHLATKTYEMGKEDVVVSEPIPITDLTHIPEVFAHARNRWEQGVCN